MTMDLHIAIAFSATRACDIPPGSGAGTAKAGWEEIKKSQGMQHNKDAGS